jgi:hypothetical protein
LLLELIRERMSGARVWSDDTPSGPFQMRDPERDLTVATPPVWERRLPFVLLAVLVGMLAYVLWYALYSQRPQSAASVSGQQRASSS